jgi:hypothetical protein
MFTPITADLDEVNISRQLVHNLLVVRPQLIGEVILATRTHDPILEERLWGTVKIQVRTVGKKWYVDA